MKHNQFSTIIRDFFALPGNAWTWEMALARLQGAGATALSEAQSKQVCKFLRSFFSNRNWASFVSPAVIDENSHKALRVIACALVADGMAPGAQNYSPIVATSSDAPTRVDSATAR